MPKTGTVGDLIRIDLDVTMPAGYQVEIPKPETQAGDFAIVDFSPGTTVPETQGGQHHRARILTAIYRTGKFAFPPIRMKLRTAEGKEVALSSPPVDIEIQSVLTGNNPKLKDLKKQAEIPEAVRWALWLTLALAGCVFVAVAWRFWRRRRRRPVFPPPAQTRDLLDLAAADLQDLLARGLPDKGMVKQFYVLLSKTVKRILELGYEIRTAEQTTSEIMISLRRRPALEPENAQRIESFLLRCDVVKFAKYVPSKIELEACAQDALQILAQARQTVVGREPSTLSG
jgi:hypothetical protein